MDSDGTRYTPMIITTGVLALRTDKRSVSVRAAPILAAARCPGYWWECRQEARVLGLSACGPRQPLDGAALAGARQL